jgi:hypothetical protein
LKKTFKCLKDTIFREFFMDKKLTKAEEDKKKQAYYAKEEKKAKEVKK